VDRQQRLTLAATAVYPLLMGAYVWTGWCRAAYGLVTYGITVGLVSAVILGYALLRHRKSA
jgi:hypothetical protein